MSTSDEQKRAAGEAAAAMIEPKMTVGLGTGSTASWFVRALAARRLTVRCVATSETTTALALSLGLEIVDLDGVDQIDLTVDGADEIGPGLSLIKGGGGALLREKLVWRASRRCVVVADAEKPQKQLGKFALPIEIAPFGARHTALRLRDTFAEMGIEAAPVLRIKDGGPVRTDGGNLTYDASCGTIADPSRLAAAIKAVTGVVDHGLFLDLAERALIGTDAGVTTLYP